MTTFPTPLDQQFADLIVDLKRRLATVEQLVTQATSTGGGAPTGPAGGDLAGLYPNPAVAKVNGVALSGAAAAGKVLTATGSAAATWQAPTPAGVEADFSYTGTLAVYTSDFRWYNNTGRTLTFGTIRATVGIVPTGASVIVDVLANGSTIFTTTANRPTIAVSTNTATSGTPNTTTLTAGSYLTVTIAQVGSTTTGSDLTVQVAMT